MKRRGQLQYLILILVIPWLITGCWDRKELEGRAIVSLVAIDKGDNNDINFSVQVVRTADPSKSSGDSGGGSERNSTIFLSSSGKTVFNALRDLILKSGRKLYYPHNAAIIIGDEAAKEGIRSLLDIFNRDAEMRPLTWVLVTPGKAADILHVPSQLESLSSQQLDMMLKDYGATSETVATRLLDVMKQLANQSSGAVLSNVELDPNETEKALLLNGAAVFRGDKLIGRLNPIETRGYLWTQGKVKSGIITFPCPGEEDKQVALEIKKAGRKIEPEIVDGKLQFTVSVKLESRLAEQSSMINLSTPKKLKELTQLQNEAVVKEIRTTLDKAQQEYDTDIFGFGTELRRRFPQEWSEYAGNWPEEFSKIDVRIVVNSRITDVGLIEQPI
jgi:spore germination protein KC